MEKYDDMISRQAAIDALCDNCNHVQAVCPHYPCKQYTSIESLPSQHPDLSGYSDKLWKAAYERGKAEAEPRWIPVTERLPEKGKRVLVTIPLVNGYPWVRTAWYGTPMFENKVCFYESDSEWGDGEISGVTAWMPLPESYRGE